MAESMLPGWSSTSPKDWFFNDRRGFPLGMVWRGEDYVAAVVLWLDDTIAVRVESIEAGKRWVEAQEAFQEMRWLA